MSNGPTICCQLKIHDVPNLCLKVLVASCALVWYFNSNIANKSSINIFFNVFLFPNLLASADPNDPLFPYHETFRLSFRIVVMMIIYFNDKRSFCFPICPPSLLAANPKIPKYV